MSSSVLTAAQPLPEFSGERPAPQRRAWLPDLLAAVTVLALALIVTGPLWLRHGVLRDNRDDPIFFQWMLTHAARIFTHGEHPLFAEELNAPFGLNLMANTSVLGLAVPLVPVTLLLGAYTSFLVMTTAGLAGTAFAWYFMLSRYLVRARAAAFVGGLFCGFAPGMVSQAIGHPNIVSQFLVPFFVLALLRLREPQRWRRTGLVVAGLVVYQTFINEEVLFLSALVLAVFVLAYGLQRPAVVRPLVPGALRSLALAAIVAGVVLAYPLYWQFRGPSAYHGLPLGVREMGTDLLAAPAFSRQSWVGSAVTAHELASSPAEENTFFGWPLLLVIAAAAAVLWRSAAARALVITMAVFWALSLGPHVRVGGKLSDVPGPWLLLADLPLFNSVVAPRLGLALIPMIGVLLALATDRFEPVRLRPLWMAVVTAALLPIAPTPLAVSAPHVPPTPAFVTSGTWRAHVPSDGVVLTVPPGWLPYLAAMQWQLDTNLEFSIVGGYYLAPTPGDPTRRANFGPAYPPTMRLLAFVGTHNVEVYVSDEHRRLAREDLRAYRVTTLVLPVAHPHAERLRRAVDQLVGPGRRVDDVWLWDVQNL